MLRHGKWLELGQMLQRQAVCVDRVKMLHVTLWDMAGVRADATCYVKLFVLTE